MSNNNNSKYNNKNKNVTTRITSETMRLGEPPIISLPVQRKSNHKSGANNANVVNNSQSASFQITGVSMAKSEFGDDSADDLDESHTEELSRITDNETPSISEDSRDIDDPHIFHQQLLTNTESSTSSQIIQIPTADFNVNTKTTTRGRWTCLDYLDAEIKRVLLGTLNNQDDNHNETTHHDEPTQGKDTQNQPYNELQVCSSPLKKQKRNSDDNLAAIKKALSATTNNEANPNNNNIDRKIEEALDAVKTHLMVAVHKEVDFLKSRVSALEGRVNELETENSALKFNYLLLKS